MENNIGRLVRQVGDVQSKGERGKALENKGQDDAKWRVGLRVPLQLPSISIWLSFFGTSNPKKDYIL